MILLASTKEFSKINANVTMGRTLECAEVTTLGRRMLVLRYVAARDRTHDLPFTGANTLSTELSGPAAIGVHDDLLTMVKKRNLNTLWYDAKTILQGTVKGARRRGRQKKRWDDNIKEWTRIEFRDSLRAAEDRERWKGIVAMSSEMPRRPSVLRD